MKGRWGGVGSRGRGKWKKADNDFEASLLPTTATVMPSGINHWQVELSLQFPAAYEYEGSRSNKVTSMHHHYS